MTQKLEGLVGYACDQLLPYIGQRSITSISFTTQTPVNVSYETANIPTNKLLPAGLKNQDLLERVMPIISEAIQDSGYTLCDTKPTADEAWKLPYVSMRESHGTMVIETNNMSHLHGNWEAITKRARAIARNHDLGSQDKPR